MCSLCLSWQIGGGCDTSEWGWVVAVVDGFSGHGLAGCGDREGLAAFPFGMLCRPVLNLDATVFSFASDVGSFVFESCASSGAAFRWRRFLYPGE